MLPVHIGVTAVVSIVVATVVGGASQTGRKALAVGVVVVVFVNVFVFP